MIFGGHRHGPYLGRGRALLLARFSVTLLTGLRLTCLLGASRCGRTFGTMGGLHMIPEPFKGPLPGGVRNVLLIKILAGALAVMTLATTILSIVLWRERTMPVWGSAGRLGLYSGALRRAAYNLEKMAEGGSGFEEFQRMNLLYVVGQLDVYLDLMRNTDFGRGLFVVDARSHPEPIGDRKLLERKRRAEFVGSLDVVQWRLTPVLLDGDLTADQAIALAALFHHVASRIDWELGICVEEGWHCEPTSYDHVLEAARQATLALYPQLAHLEPDPPKGYERLPADFGNRAAVSDDPWVTAEAFVLGGADCDCASVETETLSSRGINGEFRAVQVTLTGLRDDQTGTREYIVQVEQSDEVWRVRDAWVKTATP